MKGHKRRRGWGAGPISGALGVRQTRLETPVEGEKSGKLSPPTYAPGTA